MQTAYKNFKTWVDHRTDNSNTFRIGPQEVTHGPVMGHFLFSVNGSDLVQRLDGWRQATVHTENLHKQRSVSIMLMDLLHLPTE